MLDAEGLVGLLRHADRNHAVIANNLANLDTPGYRTARLRFAEQLERVLDQRGGLRPGRQIAAELYRPLFGDAAADGNDVALARELTELNKNALRMRLYLNVLGARIRKMRLAIEGR
jgi:flagellar basal-body rod protein FlgB